MSVPSPTTPSVPPSAAPVAAPGAVPSAGPATAHAAGALGPRAAAGALAGAAVLFVAYPALRPAGDRAAGTLEAARAFASPAWLVAHLCAVGAFVVLGLGLLGLHTVLRSRLSRAAAVVTLLGTGATLPYYGAETFALHAVGRRVLLTADPGLLGLVDDIRNQPVALGAFGAGLLLLAAGGVLTALAVRQAAPRGAAHRSWAGAPLAVGLLLFGPQFFADPPVRIAHGLLLAVGCIALARSVLSGDRAGERVAVSEP